MPQRNGGAPIQGKRYEPIVTRHVPLFLIPADARKAIESYRAMLAEYRAFEVERADAVSDTRRAEAAAADTAAMRVLIEAGKPPTNPTKNADEYAAKVAAYGVQFDVWLSRLVDAEKAVSAALAAPGDDALIQAAIDEAERRAVPYRAAIEKALAAKDAYDEAMQAIVWAVAQTTHDKTQAKVPPGKLLPKVEAAPEPLDVTAILKDSERHTKRLDSIVGHMSHMVNAARRFVYARLADDPDYDPSAKPPKHNRFYGY